MRLLRSIATRIADALRGLTDQELVAIVGLALLGIGLAGVWPPLALIIPGTVLVLIALGFNLQRGG